MDGSSGLVEIPFLTEAKDVFFTLDGGVEKIGGSSLIGPRIDTVGIDSMYDFWYSISQDVFHRRIAQIGASIYSDNGDGNYTLIATQNSHDKKIFFAQFDNDLIISSPALTDVPTVYDGSTVATLGTNTPNFAFSAVHKNRLWAAGDPDNPSTLYASETLPNGPRGDWDDLDAVTIQIDPGDGDGIRGLFSYRDNLFVFKGPNKGSIHRIEGSSPTGVDPFARRDFLRNGLPVDSPNGFFAFNDDLGFVTSDGGVHSLKSTASFGDFNEATISRPIQKFLRDNVGLSGLDRIDAVAWSEKGLVLITMPFGSSPVPNKILAMDFRFNPARWSVWDDYDAQSMARSKDTGDGSRPTVMIGGSDGAVRRIDQGGFRIEGAAGGTYTAITARIRTPLLNYAGSTDRFGLVSASLASQPDGLSTILFEWRRDSNPKQSVTFAGQASGDLLGSTFVLGTSRLGYNETRFRHSRLGEAGGEFNQIAYQISNSSITSDEGGHSMEIHGFEVALTPSAQSLENV